MSKHAGVRVCECDSIIPHRAGLHSRSHIILMEIECQVGIVDGLLEISYYGVSCLLFDSKSKSNQVILIIIRYGFVK